jgi:hypothetical protein
VIDISAPQQAFFYSLYYNIILTPCYTNGTDTCTQLPVQFQVDGPITCPAITLTTGATLGTLNCSFTSTVPSSSGISYSVVLTVTATGAPAQVWNVVSTAPPGVQSFVFSGLADNTNYTATLSLVQGVYTKTCSSASENTQTPPPPFP